MSLSVELNNSPSEQERKLGAGTTGLLDVAIADERLPILEVIYTVGRKKHTRFFFIIT